MSNIQQITYESGQLGLFFGDNKELADFTELHNNSRRKDFILAPAKDFFLTTPLQFASTDGQRFKANISTISVLKALRSRNSSATRLEQEKLAKYCGWGSLPSVFDEKNTKTSKKREQLKSLLTNDEFDSARRSTISAFYTPFYLTHAIYNMLQATGFKSGNIIDPAAGVGGLISPMPECMADESNLTLIELDNVTSEVLTHLYPSATVYCGKGFEQLTIRSNQDLVISNPPFGNAKVSDRNDSELHGLTLHNYFIGKSAKVLRLGGLMVAIVSTSFLDSKNTKTREMVANLVDLKGAVRLPKNVFNDHCGANASVDVLLLQRSSGASAKNANWVDSTEQTLPCGQTYFLNNYFIANPTAILGKMEAQAGIQGKQVQCISDSQDLVGDINSAFSLHFPKDIYTKPTQINTNIESAIEPVAGLVSDNAFIDIGGYAVTEDCVIAIRKEDNEDGTKAFEVCQEITGKRAIRIAKMIKVKQAMKQLLDLERTDGNENLIETTRKQLNTAYDAFVRANGFIQESANRRAFGNDPFYANLASLEDNFNAGVTREQAKRLGVAKIKPSADKMPIFTQRIIKPWKAATSADSAIDALWICWNDSNQIDINRIANLCNKSVIETKNELVGTAIFLDHQTGEYQFAEKYLSGDVKSKYKAVEAMVNGNTELLPNYNALKAVLPPHIKAVDISVEMNAGWLPKKVVSDFIYQLLKSNVEVEHVLGQWFVKATNVPSVIETQRFGVDGYGASKVISRMMAGRELIVRRSCPSKGRYVDKEATLQIETIATEIHTLFSDWIWSCETRRKELETLYNDKYNRYAKPKYVGEKLVFPEQSASLSLRPHQKNAVRRSLEQGSLLLDMHVGAGKTFTFATIVHEWHRLGLKSRTCVVLPNHLVEAIAIEWLALYPTEKLLVLDPKDLSVKRRKETLNRIKTGAKIVLVPESTFKTISLPLETEQEIINEEISETRSAISLLEEKFSVKRLETKLLNLEYKLNELANRSAKDESLDFAELGFDSIVADEAQSYKNRMLNTVALSNVRGIGNPTGSQRAYDMYCKCRYLSSKYSHSGIIFSTGTPISNSIVELWTMQTYLNYDQLKADGLQWLDSWAGLYTSTSSEFEVDATGMNFKPVSRLRAFKNLPELQNIYGCMAETVTREELNEYLPKLPCGGNMIPPINGGKPQTIYVDPSKSQSEFIDTLVQRAKCFSSSPIDNDNMLLLMFHARCASLDLRILDPLALDNPNSKAAACAKKAAEIYHKTASVKGTQLIFCDLSTPKKGKEALRKKVKSLMEKAATGDEQAQKELDEMGHDQIAALESNFSVYDDIKEKLIALGVQESEIAYAQDYRTPKAKAELYLQINNGVKRITLASTAMMGTGANVNKRIVGLHSLDPTYKPSCMQQRVGRAERQGNKLYESNTKAFGGLEIIYYASRRTLDNFLFQTLESKANWIESFRSCSNSERTVNALESDSVTFAEIKAEVSGNPLVLEMLQTNKLINKLNVQHKRHQQQQHDYESSIATETNSIKKTKLAIDNINKDIVTYNANKLPKGVFKASVSGLNVDKFSTAAELLERELRDFSTKRETTSQTVMYYCGFSVKFAHVWSGYEVLVEGQHEFAIRLTKGGSTSGTSIMYSISGLLKDLDKHMDYRNKRLIEHENNLSTAKSQIGKSFDSLDQLIAAKRRLAEIKHELMATEEQTEKTNNEKIAA